MGDRPWKALFHYTAGRQRGEQLPPCYVCTHGSMCVYVCVHCAWHSAAHGGTWCVYACTVLGTPRCTGACGVCTRALCLALHSTRSMCACTCALCLALRSTWGHLVRVCMYCAWLAQIQLEGQAALHTQEIFLWTKAWIQQGRDGYAKRSAGYHVI